ncbi:amino acid/amide ABC transporter substrate-binding protein, HAAT family [Enhydrobacter aerosaccus]|uniref:Amino acid/amide ABC transporter substrate-binding protein, HAAT family n=1 Tax=Enhydrobacter aerosaccus TaxID=225324 RepID=A0A1T4SPQ1_9HYPH|nr:ABC transporter substrate-binding protein [Enhydrobacter aerosaccus]SKA30264.1 amino acid/amide ABC transporter substrate-binding protein, HAAT family [Enhydrobacter aerosaccus]
MRRTHVAALLGSVFSLAFTTVAAQAADPIKIATIAETSAISGVGIPNAAKMAAEEINAAGGVNGRKIEIVEYDDHNSAADAVRAFQRAAQQDKVSAVIASYISEVVLALEPWAGRLKMPMITPGAASNEITKRVREDYDHMKYVFHGYLASTQIADAVCDSAKKLLVDDLHMKTAVIMSEDAAWTLPLDEEYKKCLPQIGLKVLDHIRLSPDTTDFTPIFNKIEASKPDVIITGISHVGVQPTVQWQQQQVPIPMFGVSSQATNATFWKDTNGATDGVIFNMVSAPDVAVTPKTIPFADNYKKKYGALPGYAAYTAYDEVYMWADAFKKAGGTDPDKVVAAMEQTDYVGTIGRIVFLPKTDTFAHGMRIGEGYITGLMVQWQKGNPITVWPEKVATGKMAFPAFIKLPQ